MQHLARWIVLSACLTPLTAQKVDLSSGSTDLGATLKPTRTRISSDEFTTTITTTIVAFSETQTFEITEHEKCLFDCTIQAQSELAGSIPDCTTDTMWQDICWCHSEFHLAVMQCMNADSFCQTILQDGLLSDFIQVTGEVRDEVCNNETVRPEYAPSSSASVSSKSHGLSPTQIGILAGGLALSLLATAYSTYTIYRRYRAQKRSALSPIPFPADRQQGQGAAAWGDVSSGHHHQSPLTPWTGDTEARGEEGRDINVMEEASQRHPLLVPHRPGLDHELDPGPESPEKEIVESSRLRPTIVGTGRSGPNAITPYTKGALEARDMVASLVQASQAIPMHAQTQSAKRGFGPGPSPDPDNDPSPTYASDASPTTGSQSPPSGRPYPSPEALVVASYPETPAQAQAQPPQAPTPASAAAQAATTLTLTPIRRMNTEARRRQASLRRELVRVEAELREIGMSPGGLESGASPMSPVQLGTVPVPALMPLHEHVEGNALVSGEEGAVASGGGGGEDADTARERERRQAAQLRREIERLNRMLESAWALGDSDVPPPGYGAHHDQ
ncbi:hypothetical protein AX16_006504 [Volvariella volvacea WC 439]|nr:hypothetical protein AX16_006504 [Volvariella volvacea WC 439]